MQRWMKTTLAGLGVVSMLALAGCSERDTNADQESRDEAYEKVMKAQPGKQLEYSPTRETINFWVDTWNEPGKLSYVYLQNTSGDVIGYYVLKGLPVSYCAQISPPDRMDTRHGGSDTTVVRQAPANDGAYYGDGNCNTFYGQDATSGSYVEYTAGMGINVLLFDAPMLNQGDAEPLGPTSVDDVK